MPFSLRPTEEVVALLAQRPAEASFNYVVTPNVDHVVRALEEGERIARLYTQAWLSVCDSRILRRLAALLGVDLPLTTGSDLTRTIFERVLRPGDAITIIGCRAETVAILAELWPSLRIAHYDPPMGFIGNEAEVARVVDFVQQHPARFVFLAVGSPRQEIVALRIRQQGGAVGIGLCIGNSLNFLAYPESRAPGWVGRMHLEWLHRLTTDPLRLWRRYLVDNPAIFAIFLRAAMTGTAIRPIATMGGEGLVVRPPSRD